MGYDRNAPWMTCGERDDECAALGIDEPFGEIVSLRDRINKMQAALLAAREYIGGDDNPRSNRVLQQIYLALTPACDPTTLATEK